MKLFLKNLKIYDLNNKDVTLRCKFIKCWIITINSIHILWQRLAEVGFKYLKTRRVNQDCLENYFGSVRQQSGNSVNPTPIQFERTFRKLFCQCFLHSEHMNCEDDLGVLLSQLKETKNVYESTAKITNSSQAITLPDYDYRNENITTQNAFAYVCGYLINKALQKHSCDICVNFSKESQTVDKTNLFLKFKAYDDNKGAFGSLKSPSEEFVHYIYRLEQIFLSLFDDVSCSEGISNYFFSEMSKITFVHPCTEFPKIYLIKLFVRLRIFYTLKYANRDLKSTKKTDKTNRKVMILSHL